MNTYKIQYRTPAHSWRDGGTVRAKSLAGAIAQVARYYADIQDDSLEISACLMDAPAKQAAATKQFLADFPAVYAGPPEQTEAQACASARTQYKAAFTAMAAPGARYHLVAGLVGVWLTPAHDTRNHSVLVADVQAMAENTMITRLVQALRMGVKA